MHADDRPAYLVEVTLALSLSGLEVVFLLDSLRNGAAIKDIEDEVGSLRPLILQLSSLYRELVTPTGIAAGPLTLQVNEAQVWLMRAKVRTGDIGIDGKTNVGVGLSLKLYALLAEFESGFSDLAVVDDPPLTVHQTEELQKLKGDYDAGRDESSTNAD